MGAALIVPVVVVVIALAIWFTVGVRKTREQAKLDETLPVEPYARRDEEVRRLRDQHAETDPARTEHPARRP